MNYKKKYLKYKKKFKNLKKGGKIVSDSYTSDENQSKCDCQSCKDNLLRNINSFIDFIIDNDLSVSDYLPELHSQFSKHPDSCVVESLNTLNSIVDENLNRLDNDSTYNPDLDLQLKEYNKVKDILFAIVKTYNHSQDSQQITRRGYRTF